MQVAGIRRLGARVEMIEVSEPRRLASDEVLLEVRAAGVANWDEFVRAGGWDVGSRPPMALGVEAAGTVLAAGQAVSDWAPGDAVMTHPVPLRDQGTWAPRLIAPAGLLARKPPGASWEAAAAFPVPAITAEQVLGNALSIRAGEPLLIHGAGGVTGGLLAALAVLRGAEVIATAGPLSRQRVSALGVRHVIDYHDQDWPEQVRAITGGREWPLRPTWHPAAPPPPSARLPTAGAWRPSPQIRPASSAASRSPASTSARTEASCANSRSSSQTASWRFRSPPATASPMLPRHSPTQLGATLLEPSSSRSDQPGKGLVVRARH
jgi:threonine dehydrogenase-like Zn-dependent dehydrogenase